MLFFKNNELLFNLWVWTRVAVAARSSKKEDKGGDKWYSRIVPLKLIFLLINVTPINKNFKNQDSFAK